MRSESVEIGLYQRANVRVGEIASSAEYRMDEKFQNMPIFQAKFWFSKLKTTLNLLIFQIVKFWKFVFSLQF